MSSSPVLARAVTLSGSRISAETLRQRLEVDVAQDADVLTIRVVDPTARGAAQLANAVATAYEHVLVRQWRERFSEMVRQLRDMRSRLRPRLAELDAELAGSPTDSRLRARRAAVADQLSLIQRQLMEAEGRQPTRPSLALERGAVPKQPITPGPGRAMAIGLLLGLLTSAVLVWWRTRGQGPTSRSSAPEQGAISHRT
jgi:capsular polysaccharide biosynthesis protein